MKHLFLAFSLLFITVTASAADLLRIVVNAPGPRNISYLPIDLIPTIDVDKEEGVRLQILHTGGGAVAMKNMVTRNADFAVTGVPAAMSLKANGGDVVVIAPVDDALLFVLMVRADLKGKVIGVNTSTKASKTTSQQLAELLLKSDDVPLNSVRIVPAGQSWVEQSSLMISGRTDAVATSLSPHGCWRTTASSSSPIWRDPKPSRRSRGPLPQPRVQEIALPEHLDGFDLAQSRELLGGNSLLFIRLAIQFGEQFGQAGADPG